MTLKKKVFMGVGPLVAAMIIIACLFSFDIALPLPKKEVEFQATARNYKMVTGQYVRNQILSDERYIPFYSSSEMAIFDEFHPNLLAEKYDRDYRPFIAGRDAQGALSHFLEIDSTAEKHRKKKVVYLLSPNSFQLETGMIDMFYENFHSKLQLSHWLLSIEEPEVSEAYLAKRLLVFKVVNEDSQLKPLLEKIAQGKSLGTIDKIKLEVQYRKERSEDNFYSLIKGNRFNSAEIPESNKLKGMNNYQYAKKYKMKHLPEKYDHQALDVLASEIGKETSQNNEFGFFDLKYKHDFGDDLKRYKNSRKNKQYTNSVEYSDFQLVLKEFAKLEMEPLFIMVPINEKFLEYTGTPEHEIEGLNKKLNEQLTSQGFRELIIVDGKKPYTHVDAAHIGRRAWVEVDQYLTEFMADESPQSTNYQIDDKYFTDEWAKKKY